MSKYQPIPDDIRRFVLACVPSVPYLEAALLFHRRPVEERSAQDVGTALYISESQARELLQALCDGGLLAQAADRFRYAARDEALAKAMDGLAAAYPHHLIEITRLIHSGAGKNAVRFADAFKFRKEP